MWRYFYLNFGTEEAVDLSACEGLTTDHYVVGPINGEGWHVNLAIRDADLPEALTGYQVFPGSPEVVWA
jgi:hypothetical protein